MKRTLLLLCAAAGLMAACATHENRNVNEPAGAEATSAPTTQLRDINQMPYSGTGAPVPGTDANFDVQRNNTARGPSGARSFEMNPHEIPAQTNTNQYNTNQ